MLLVTFSPLSDNDYVTTYTSVLGNDYDVTDISNLPDNDYDTADISNMSGKDDVIVIFFLHTGAVVEWRITNRLMD